MSRVQTRRTVSVNAPMADALKRAAARVGASVARYAHDAIAARMRSDGIEPPRYRAPSYAPYGVTADDLTIELARQASVGEVIVHRDAKPDNVPQADADRAFDRSTEEMVPLAYHPRFQPRRFLCDHDGCAAFVDFGFPLTMLEANVALAGVRWKIHHHTHDPALDRHHCPEHVR